MSFLWVLVCFFDVFFSLYFLSVVVFCSWVSIGWLSLVCCSVCCLFGGFGYWRLYFSSSWTSTFFLRWELLSLSSLHGQLGWCSAALWSFRGLGVMMSRYVDALPYVVSHLCEEKVASITNLSMLAVGDDVLFCLRKRILLTSRWRSVACACIWLQVVLSLFLVLLPLRTLWCSVLKCRQDVFTIALLEFVEGVSLMSLCSVIHWARVRNRCLNGHDLYCDVTPPRCRVRFIVALECSVCSQVLM